MDSLQHLENCFRIKDVRAHHAEIALTRSREFRGILTSYGIKRNVDNKHVWTMPTVPRVGSQGGPAPFDTETAKVLDHCVRLFDDPPLAASELDSQVRALHELREYLPSIGVPMKPLLRENYGKKDFSKLPLPVEYDLRIRAWRGVSDRMFWCSFLFEAIGECLRDALISGDLGVIDESLWVAATFIVETHALPPNHRSLRPTKAQEKQWTEEMRRHVLERLEKEKKRSKSNMRKNK